MEKIIQFYHEAFPQTGLSDWFYALLGLMLHVIVKLKNVSFKHFKWKVFLGEFLPVWFFCLISIVILVGTLPIVLSNYSGLDSALIGYASSSIFKQMFKSKIGNMNILMD